MFEYMEDLHYYFRLFFVWFILFLLDAMLKSLYNLQQISKDKLEIK